MQSPDVFSSQTWKQCWRRCVHKAILVVWNFGDARKPEGMSRALRMR